MPPITPESVPLILSALALIVSVSQAVLARRQAVAAARAVYLQQQQLEREGKLHEVKLVPTREAAIIAEISTGATPATVRKLSLLFEFRYPDRNIFFPFVQHHHYIWSAPESETWLFFHPKPDLPHRMERNDLWQLTLPGLYFIEKKADELADMRVSLTAETTTGNNSSEVREVVRQRTYGGIKCGSTGLRLWGIPFLTLYEEVPRDVFRMLLMAIATPQNLELVVVAMYMQQTGTLGKFRNVFQLEDFKPGGAALRQPSHQQLAADIRATLDTLRGSLGDNSYAHKIALVDTALRIRDAARVKPAESDHNQD